MINPTLPTLDTNEARLFKSLLQTNRFQSWNVYVINLRSLPTRNLHLLPIKEALLSSYNRSETWQI